MCPLCMVVVSRTEAEMLSHLLAEHPLALLVVSVCLAVANVALANRPVSREQAWRSNVGNGAAEYGGIDEQQVRRPVRNRTTDTRGIAGSRTEPWRPVDPGRPEIAKLLLQRPAVVPKAPLRSMKSA